jgi:dienelactone hydrolase
MDARYEAALPLFDYDAGAPLELERRPGRPQHVDLLIEDVSYASPAGGTVTAFLVSPAATGRYAGLLMLHGSGGSRNDMLREGVKYAGLGVIVLLIDAPFARRPGEWIRLTETDRDEQIQLMLDLRRGVDVLLAAGADKDRIGFLGYSYGAAMGSGLSGIERRIRAYVLDVGDGGLVSHFTGSDDAASPLTGLSADRRAAWLAAMEPIEPLYFVRHAAPTELLFQSARMDSLIPVEDAERLHEQASEPKTVLWYESDHGLPTAAWCDQADWLRDRLAFDDRPWAPSCA